MGLDMYMYRRRKNEDKDEEIAYWRKFNALHGYILDLVDAAPDSNTEELDLSLDDLNTIYETLLRVNYLLETSAEPVDGIYPTETAEAISEFFPPADGMLWGDKTIDEYFKEDVEYSIKKFKEVILPLARQGEEIYYWCWW